MVSKSIVLLHVNLFLSQKKYVNTFLVEVMFWESDEHHDLMEQFRYVLVKG